MASSTKIRLAPDVEAIALDIAKRKGLGGARQAVEAVMRVCWQHYLSGDCTPAPASSSPAASVPADGNAALAELGF